MASKEEVLKALTRPNVVDEEAAKAFEKFDTGKTGFIPVAEFGKMADQLSKMAGSRQPTEEEKKKMQETVAKYSTDGKMNMEQVKGLLKIVIDQIVASLK